jgi:phosphatidate cytidylyltransferase
MAFNWSTFKTRSLTALVFVLIMLTGLLWNHWSFFVLFSVIHFGCWWEYFKLTEKIHRTSFHIYTKLGMMLAGFGILLWLSGPVYHISQYSFKDNFSMPVSAAGFILMIIGVLRGDAVNVKGYGMAGLGILYISLCWGMMIDLTGFPFDIFDSGDFVSGGFSFVLIPVVLIAAIWINDTMAYIVGSLIGKTPLSPVSPKKTWEGTVGGILLATLVTGFLTHEFAPVNFQTPGRALEIPSRHWYIIAGIAAIAGTFGDLLESKLKRMAGVKDSGTLMPGHGGFLDRFDSLLLATPAVWVYVRVFMH